MSQFMGEKKYNKNIAQINPFSPPECSSRRVKLLFIKADTWLANIDGLFFFTIVTSITYILSRKPGEWESAKRKGPINMEKAGISHEQALGLNLGAPDAECVTSY